MTSVSVPGLCFGRFTHHLVRSAGLIHAEWLLGEEVTGSCERASATSHAHVAELAAAALPFQVIVIAEHGEDRRFVPDFRKALLAQIAGDRGQVPAREYFAFMRDEADAGSGEAALGHRVHIARMAARMAGVFCRRNSLRPQGNSS